MTKIDDGGPAFPFADDATTSNAGTTLRDWFAGQALAALIAKAPFFDREGEFGKPVDMLQFKADMAESAYGYANAMIAARKGGDV